MFSHGYLIWFAVVDVQQQVAFDRQKIEELLYRLLQYTFQQDARATVIIMLQQRVSQWEGQREGASDYLRTSNEIFVSITCCTYIVGGRKNHSGEFVSDIDYVRTVKRLGEAGPVQIDWYAGRELQDVLHPQLLFTFSLCRSFEPAAFAPLPPVRLHTRNKSMPQMFNAPAEHGRRDQLVVKLQLRLRQLRQRMSNPDRQSASAHGEHYAQSFTVIAFKIDEKIRKF
ncbi:hypothetical protein PRIPAC_88006 [Pristionchus pacificus]|uniref:Uncharacterized protein n=1 Tax=Pristionchus pacificus TaxID=54126 RepID=A0A2A6CWK6_PRIPA|nr:hypothetical protein PRIPAC_88006 [Pristionchus pacificus]|eukprot:PDM82413.1 hypothetical protein PRIPAC_36806 [Pristionchus pacificus]